jgi:catechol-2,3-dioxygenase
MKRLHVHVAVNNVDEATKFYETLFAAAPTVRKLDYVKWMLDDPRVNFAISSRGSKTGLDHLGIQAETAEELAEIGERLAKADRKILVQECAACCYARSDKAWVNDPTGIAWETFHTHGEITVYGEDTHHTASATPGPKSACCDRPAA